MFSQPYFNLYNELNTFGGTCQALLLLFLIYRGLIVLSKFYLYARNFPALFFALYMNHDDLCLIFSKILTSNIAFKKAASYFSLWVLSWFPLCFLWSRFSTSYPHAFLVLKCFPRVFHATISRHGKIRASMSDFLHVSLIWMALRWKRPFKRESFFF